MNYDNLFEKIYNDFKININKKYILISWITCDKGEYVLKNNYKYKASNYNFYSIVKLENCICHKNNDTQISYYELIFKILKAKINENQISNYKNLVVNNYLSIKISMDFIQNLHKKIENDNIENNNNIDNINIFNNIPYIYFFIYNNEENIIKIFGSGNPKNIFTNDYNLLNFIEIPEKEDIFENEINMKIKLLEDKNIFRLKLVKSIVKEMKEQLDNKGLKEIKNYLEENNI
jgi:hypothetical protein